MVSFCLSFIPQTGQQADKLAAVYRLPWGTHIKHLDLSGQKLTEIPGLSMYDIESLDLSHNDIQRLTPEQLRHLPLSLKQLNLSHNELEQYVDIYPYVNIEYQYGIDMSNLESNVQKLFQERQAAEFVYWLLRGLYKRHHVFAIW